MEFVRIAPGEFMMGCAADDTSCTAPEKPARRVQITRAFEIGRHEVTQAEWQAVMGSNPSYFKGNNLPVDQIGWNDAQQFLEKLNARNDGYRYRLPTEAEWEFAARGPANAPAPGRLEDVAWFDANAGRQTHPVGQKQPNARGLYDMLGNVSEWVEDRVLRGGSFVGSSAHVRPSYRIQMPPAGSSNPTMGFRYVRVPLN
jgi:formylglycine-generating enzyme required for sulfatase activity